MDITLSILAVVFGIVGCIGCIVPVLPGVLLTYIGYLCLYFVSGVDMSLAWVVAFGVLTLVLTIVDYLLPAYLTKRSGGTKAGEWGATIGVIVGMFLGPIGIIGGSFIGAFVGELLHDNKDTDRALKSGISSFLSFIVGTLSKLAISVWMTVHIFIHLSKLLF